MIKSMTGFGHGEAFNAANQKVTVEMKAVNHRYCDVSLKLPKKFTMFEAAIRKIIKEYASRGKIDVYISFEDLSQTGIGLRYNQEIAREYMDIFRKMQEEFQIEMDITASQMARFPEVISVEEKPQDEEVWWELIEKALREAAEKFAASRSVEGENLKADLLLKLAQMEEDVNFIEQRSPDIVKNTGQNWKRGSENSWKMLRLKKTGLLRKSLYMRIRWQWMRRLSGFRVISIL